MSAYFNIFNSARILVVLFCVILVTSCATRTPEDPTGSRGTYQPPTSPAIVLENFRNAVEEKNTENFILCLADQTTRSKYEFTFQPSAEARARYQSLFSSWTVQKERQAFLSMIARLALEQRPSLVFSNTNIAFASPDSTVYVTDYTFIVAHGLSNVSETLNGTAVFTITPENSGQWSVSGWSDAKRQSDSVENTWSQLKAQLTN
ncbi:MAG: hypothetical protein HQ472_07995 [Ignavibacteria bacterium]|nr:hypothetical protein [Ignavibacteria bacterium]